ncbi:MAG: BatA domain-containing protein [Planctomycetota bacterium]
MILLNPGLLGGLAVALLPLVIHLLHRRRAHRVQWGAMRFLEILLATSRRRLALERWLLLGLRCLILALIALALCRPALVSGPAPEERIVRNGRTAAILLIDDSLSTAVGRGQPRMEAVKALAQAYLDSLEPGDEVSVLTASGLADPPGDPLFDLDSARALVAGLHASQTTADIPELLAAGSAQISRHLNPAVELVLLTDGAAAGWQAEDRALWSELCSRLRTPGAREAGTRGYPRLFVCTPPARAGEENLGIAALDSQRALIPPATPIALRVAVFHHGRRVRADTRIQLRVDGRIVAERAIRLKPGQEQEAVFTHAFAQPGSHVVEAILLGARDDLPDDDRRLLALEVAEREAVLLVEGHQGPGLGGSLAFVAAALAPEPEEPGLFAPRRIAVTELAGHDLTPYRVVVLGDVPALEAEAVAALERHLVAGGGILLTVGPETDAGVANRSWARGGDGFLPAPIAEPVTSSSALFPRTVAGSHRALRAFIGTPQAAWQDTRVRRYLRLDTAAVPPGELQVLLALSDGSSLLVERRRGLGAVMMLSTSADPSWSDLALQPAFAPLIRGTVAHLGGRVFPPRNLVPGQALAHPGASDERVVSVVDDAGRDLPVTATAWRGKPVFATRPLERAGVYTVRDGLEAIHYAVAVDPREGGLAPLGWQRLHRLLAPVAPVTVTNPERLRALFAAGAREHHELWRQMVVVALLLLIAELLLVRRTTRAERGVALGREPS